MGGRLAAALGGLRSDRVRWPLALAVGILFWGLSLPPYGIGLLAVLAFIPALYALPEEPLGRVAAWGWLGGTIWEFVTLWWLIPTLVSYGGIPEPLALALIVGMCAILGLYTAGFLWTVAWVVRGRGEQAVLVAPFVYVLWEWVRGHLFTGFPWWGPGYALSLYPPLLQVTRITGILGLSFLALLAASAITAYLRDRRHPVNALVMPVSLFCFACAAGWGWWASGRPVTPAARIPVGYLQPEVPQDVKWDADFAGQIQVRLLDLAGSFKKYGLKVMVWPESCTPFDWDGDEAYRAAVARVAAETEAPILLGSLFKTGAGYQNGAVLVLPEGGEGGRYAKTHLVPFGEYVPLREWLFFAKPVVDVVSDLVPGTSLAPVGSPAGKLGVTICYEGVFPELVRKQVNLGAEILVNITNDAWYQGTPGPAQHFLMERVRAVENDRYLVRSANVGISGVVNPRGRLEATTAPGGPAAFWGLVSARRTHTPWSRIGNLWLLIPLAVVIWMARPPRQKGRGRPL
jgi:apolipoprotein N-acyltransferase